MIADFRDLPLTIQAQLAIVVPLLAGAVCGFLLGVSEPAWWISQIVVTLGGVAAGTEHPRPSHGAIRGALSGTMLGIGIVIANATSGDPAQAPLPSPAILVVAITAVGGILSGSTGARLSSVVHRTASPHTHVADV
jgi:hypothetical protein